MTNVIINNKEKWLHITNSNLNRKYEFVSMSSYPDYTLFKCRHDGENVTISVYNNRLVLIQIS